MKTAVTASIEERLRDFSRRYCSVETSGEAENDEQERGHFAFYVGRTERDAKNAGQATGSIVFASQQRTEAVLIDKVTELLNRKEGHVFVYAYWYNCSSYDAKLKIEGSTEEAKHHTPNMEHGPLAAMAEMNARMCAMVMDDNENLRARLEKHQEFAIGMTEALTREHIYRRAYEEGAQSQAMGAAFEALIPTFNAFAPALAARFLGGSVQLPDEPRPRLQAAIGVIMGMLNEIGKALSKAPELGADQALFAPLKDVILKVGPAIGLQVIDLTAKEGASA